MLFLQETKRPSKEMQVSIARQLGLQPTTVGNFFMNARRRLAHERYEQEALAAAAAATAAAAAAAAAADDTGEVIGVDPTVAAAITPTMHTPVPPDECDLDQIELDQHKQYAPQQPDEHQPLEHTQHPTEVVAAAEAAVAAAEAAAAEYVLNSLQQELQQQPPQQAEAAGPQMPANSLEQPQGQEVLPQQPLQHQQQYSLTPL